METRAKFQQLMGKMGITVHRAVQLGKWLHIDTNKKEEMKIRRCLAIMGATRITTLQKDRAGRHLDGSRYHRIVAEF